MYARGHPPERRQTEIETSSNNTWFFSFLLVHVLLVHVLLVCVLLIRVLLVRLLLVRVLLVAVLQIHILLVRILLVRILLVRVLLVRLLLVQSSPVQSTKYSMPKVGGFILQLVRSERVRTAGLWPEMKWKLYLLTAVTFLFQLMFFQRAVLQ